MRRLYTKRVSREDAGQAVYAKRNEKGRSICEDGHKKFVMIQEKLQEYFTKEEQEELKRLLNKFCDCLDEQTEILKKERKEKSDA